MSKSKGNVLYADELVDFFGVDAVRYFVLHEMPFDNDGVITWELMIERMNSDLANTLGNLVNRTIAMTNKYFGGTVANKNVAEPVDEELKEVTLNAVKLVAEKMDKLRVADAMTEIFNIFKRCNKYIDETMPWALAKDEEKQDRLATVLYNLVESIVIGASLLESFMPETAKKIVEQLNCEIRGFDSLNEYGKYVSGTKLTDKPEILFARLDVNETMKKIEELMNAKKAEVEGENKMEETTSKEITIDDFDKVEMKVAKVLEAEKVEGSNKLIKFKVSLGNEERQIVSGIQKYYEPEDLIGKKLVVVTNLKPVKLKGIESQGMLLAAGDGDVVKVLVVDDSVEEGADVH
jgi:methionyl-tRNA synthetase